MTRNAFDFVSPNNHGSKETCYLQSLETPSSCLTSTRIENRTETKLHARIHSDKASQASVAAGAAGVTDFFGVVDFFAGVLLGVFFAFFGAVVVFFAGLLGFAGPLVTRPDLVFPRTFYSSLTAGACTCVSAHFAKVEMH